MKKLDRWLIRLFELVAHWFEYYFGRDALWLAGSTFFLAQIAIGNSIVECVRVSVYGLAVALGVLMSICLLGFKTLYVGVYRAIRNLPAGARNPFEDYPLFQFCRLGLFAFALGITIHALIKIEPDKLSFSILLFLLFPYALATALYFASTTKQPPREREQFVPSESKA